VAIAIIKEYSSVMHVRIPNQPSEFIKIKNAGLETWVHKVSLLGGQNWENEIKTAIRNSRIGIVE
jgi:hypothetical protein